LYSMTDRIVCLDIHFGGDRREIIEKIRERVASRKPQKGSLVYRSEQRWSSLRGGEVGLLKRLAALEVKGRIESIDAIFEGGINIAASIDEGKETR